MPGVGITSTSVVVLVLGLCATAIASSCVLEKSATTSALNRTDGSPAGILKLLREGRKLLELREDDRDMVVFMGITGAGKTTFVLHIGGNDEDLTSKETRPRSGEYIIEDRCNRSSSAAKTLESFTLVPDRFVDSETKMTYFDMPGFSDTRPLVAYDIAAAYFTKLVLDYARRIKLVFVVNHSHVKMGEDRGRFSELVEHITTLIRDVSKFRDSMALIVSKVGNIAIDSTTADFPYVPDEEVVEGIADFLKDAKSFYLEGSGGKVGATNKAAQLMDIFLQKSNNSFARIGVFRKPDRPGPLLNVTSLQRNKRNLKAIIDSNIRYSEKSADDFGYTLSERSKNTLYKLREEVLRNTTARIRAIADRIEARYAAGEHAASDLDEVMAVFSQYPVVDEVKALKRIDDVVDFVEALAQRWQVNITSPESTKEIRDNEKSMNFLNEISGELVDWTSAIHNGTEELADFLRHSISWYHLFLNTMYDTFSSYEVQVQRARPAYSGSLTRLLNEIDLLRRASSTRGTNVAELTTIKSFLKEIGSETLSRIYDSLGPLRLNDPKLHFLQMVLNATLSPSIEVERTSCKDDKFTVNGRHILLSRVANQLSSSCPRPRFVHILASERIFIDANFNLTGTGVEAVSMIAPVWHIKGRVEITLDGAAGKQPETRALDGTFSSKQWLRNGKDGEPGEPGGPAAHFVGIGADFINSDQLTISARGGRGGNGQNGGNGHRGADSSEAQPYNGDRTDFNYIWPGYSHKMSQDYSSGFWRSFGYTLGVAKDKRIYSVEVAASGENGGDGGDGGAGGVGGNRGTILVTNLNTCQNTSITTIATDGDAGRGGRYGEGGVRGQVGRTLVEIYTEETYWWSDERRTLRYKGYFYPGQRTRDGFDGTDGANSIGQKSPSRNTLSAPDNGVDDFRAFARSSLPNTLRKNALKQMLGQLGDKKMFSLYNEYTTLSFEKKLQACSSSQNGTHR